MFRSQLKGQRCAQVLLAWCLECRIRKKLSRLSGLLTVAGVRLCGFANIPKLQLVL